MTKTNELLVRARTRWIEAAQRSDEAREEARLAENMAAHCFAEYSQIKKSIKQKEGRFDDK
jgi:hypothetical protein